MAENERKFKKHTIEVTVLEEFFGENILCMSLGEIAHEMHAGRFVGTWSIKKSEELDPKEMSCELIEAGSEPEALDIDSSDSE